MNQLHKMQTKTEKCKPFFNIEKPFMNKPIMFPEYIVTMNNITPSTDGTIIKYATIDTRNK